MTLDDSVHAFRLRLMTRAQDLGIEFRPRSFTRTSQMQVALDSHLELSNHRRAYQGNRTRGRTPGEIFVRRSNLGRRPTRARSVKTIAALDLPGCERRTLTSCTQPIVASYCFRLS